MKGEEVDDKDGTPINEAPSDDEHVDVAGENNDKEVRALAASLAPQMEELETLLDTPSKELGFDSTTHSSAKEDDDDDMDTEWSQLKNSEQLLRQELEFAHDFSHLFQKEEDEAATPQNSLDPPESKAPVSLIIAPTTNSEPPPAEIVPSTPPATGIVEEAPPTPTSSYTLAHHARHLGFKVEPRGGWYSYPIGFEDAKECFAREYILPIPTTDLKRLYVGIMEHPLQQQPEPKTVVSPSSSPKQPSLLDDASLPSSISGFVAVSSEEQILPVRTVTIRIRPDVLCGAVMDAVNHSLDNLGAEVTKRQGGHLRGIVGPTRVVPHHEIRYDDLPSRWLSPSEQLHQQEQKEHEDAAATHDLPPFSVDVQLVVYKGSNDHNCERILLIRTYPIVEEEELVPSMTESDPVDVETPSLLLKESSALVQRIESEGSSTCLISNNHHSSPSSSIVGYFSPLKLFSSSPSQHYDTVSSLPPQEAIAAELINHVRPCPSVLAGGLTLPALSKQDWPVVQSSWRFIQDCWNELETRDLAYATLAETNFGAFPALPTLDVHYCSQMRRVCREGMVVSLLKSASELEQFARESEYSCASLVQTLKPSFEYYHLQPPALPRPVPLTAYPLDYTPPQVSCPPWGLTVMEAMNRVAATSSDNNLLKEEADSFHAAEKAVGLVLAAFQRQDDEEQGARLGRKNVQVMDRLAKMQAHKRASINAIAESYGKSPQDIKAADDFHSNALQAVRDTDERDYHEVPLFWCGILVGGTTRGTCYVTARHLLVKTKAIPLVGGSKCTLFDLTEIDFDLYEPSRLMNPIVAAGITILQHNEPVYSFRPYVGAQRFKSFVEIIKEAAMENPNKLKFSDRGGLLYLYGDETEAETTTISQPPTIASLEQDIPHEEEEEAMAANLTNISEEQDVIEQVEATTQPELAAPEKEMEESNNEEPATAQPTMATGEQNDKNQEDAATEPTNPSLDADEEQNEYSQKEDPPVAQVLGAENVNDEAPTMSSEQDGNEEESFSI